jgi:predicted O-linked N-acetylglucosamine transferase (SPINDLY family)
VTRPERDAADTLAASGRWAEAAAILDRLVSNAQDDPQLLTRLGVAQFQSGRYADSVAAFEAVVRVRPDGAGAFYNLGRALVALGALDDAGAAFGRATSLSPCAAPAYLAWATALADAGRDSAALRVYEAARDAGCDEANLCLFHGLLLERLGEPGAAADRLAAATRSPELAANAHLHLASCLAASGERHRALTALDAARAAGADPHEVRFRRALLLLEAGDPATAVEDLRAVVAARPEVPSVHRALGIAYLAQGHLDHSATHLEQALRHDDTDHEAWEALGDVHQRRHALLASAECYRHALRALEAQPDSAAARAAVLEKQASAFVGMGEFARAREATGALLGIVPDYPDAAGLHLLSCLWVGDWTDFDTRRDALIAAVKRDEPCTLPFPLLCLTDDPEIQQAHAHSYLSRLGLPPPDTIGRLVRRAGRLRLAYLSPDFRNHPVGHLIASTLEQHDRTRFEVLALSTDPLPQGTAIETRLRCAVDQFVDLSGEDDATAARHIQALGVDLLVDLAGHTRGARPELLARRAAPVQIGFLGFPGTYGPNLMHYMIADDWVIPAELEAFYDGRVVRVPGSLIPPADARRDPDRAPVRADFGLPEDATIVCAFHSAYKIQPATFALWMAVLSATPAAILWLSTGSTDATEAFRRAAASHGIDPERLHFAGRVDDHATHLGRLGLADLFLDTYPYNAHSSAADVLWAGVPIITRSGRSFASRVCGGLLNAIGLPELVAGDDEGYLALTLELLRQPAALRALKVWLRSRGRESSVFQSNVYTKNLESAYLQIWEDARTMGAPS